MSNCKSCGYPYVPYQGKHNGVHQYGICPNCGYNNWVSQSKKFFKELKQGVFGIIVLIIILIMTEC